MTYFNEQVQNTIKKCHIKLASKKEDYEKIFHLRYRCYLKEQLIDGNEKQILRDSFDSISISKNFLVEIDGKICAAIRIQILNKDNYCSPTYDAFQDYIQDVLDGGKTILDPNRFVVDEEASKKHAGLAYATLRIPFMMADYSNADIALAAVRREHMPFYKRYLLYDQAEIPKPYLQLKRPLGLMVTDYIKNKEMVLKKLSFLNFSGAEINNILN